jgi:hypothetical protein
MVAENRQSIKGADPGQGPRRLIIHKRPTCDGGKRNGNTIIIPRTATRLLP